MEIEETQGLDEVKSGLDGMKRGIDGLDGMEFRYRTLSEGVESVIRRMILLGEMTPGMRINEVQLAEQLEMSRGPVREALRRLQSEGLVIYHAHRGTFVSELSDKDAEEMYKLRALFEVGALQMGLANVNAAVLRHLETIVANFDQCLLRGDSGGLIQADIDFHHTVVKLSGNSRLFDLYRTLDTQLGTLFLAVQQKVPARIKQLPQMHQTLVDALRQGDEQTVASAFEAHYLSAWQSLLAVNRSGLSLGSKRFR